MSLPSSSDVLIVGAGPAGAWTAWRLARAGARVTIVDGSHPREKPCGGGVTGRALLEMGPALAGRLPNGVTITGAWFEDPDPRLRQASVPLPASRGGEPPSLIVFSRRELDRALLEAAQDAGARLVPEHAVHVGADAGSTLVETRTGRHRGGWLVGADGATSLVRRSLAQRFTRAQLSIATGLFAFGRSEPDVRIRFVPDPPGYIWSFPRPDHLAIGICAQADQARTGPLRRIVEGWAEHASLVDGARRVPYSWPIPSLSAADFARERPAGRRWLLVGDAAGLVDPITREGIYFAARSGTFAADALLSSAPDPAADYAARLHDELYPELAHAARLKTGFFRGPFTRLLVQALGESARVREVMADLVAGEQPYATLKRRLIATFEWRLAWRLLLLEIEGRRSGSR